MTPHRLPQGLRTRDHTDRLKRCSPIPYPAPPGPPPPGPPATPAGQDDPPPGEDAGRDR
jgi:hypothetical protein